VSNCLDWKEEIKISQNYICPFCGLAGTSGSMNIHHKLAKSRGGKGDKENCIAVHIVCHRAYHKKYGRSTSDCFGNPLDSGKGWMAMSKKKPKRKKHQKRNKRRR